MRRLVLVALTAFAVSPVPGCYQGDDPYAGVADDPCAPGNVRAAGMACVAPVAAIVIDGDAADWQGVPAVPVTPTCLRAPCDSLEAETLQFARSKDELGRDTLAFHVRLVGGGAPRHDTADLRYVVELTETPTYPTGTHDRILIGFDESRYLRNGVESVTPVGLAPPFLALFTGDGVEGMISVAFLPFPFGASIGVAASVFDPATHVWLDKVSAAPVARACWIDALPRDAASGFRGDPCASARP